jgi:hypothetical protein
LTPRSFIADLVAVNGDDLMLRREGTADPVAVPRSAITSLEVSRGRKSKIKGIIIGALIGAGAGAAVGAAAAGTSECQPEVALCGTPEDITRGADYAAEGLLVGTGVGALVGALLVRGERWEVVSSDKLSVSLHMPTVRTVGLRLSVAF